MIYKKIIKNIAAVVCTVQVTNHSLRAHVSSSLRSPRSGLQSKVGSCLSLLHAGASSVEGSEVLRKCCQFPERAACPVRARDLVRCCPQLKEMWKRVVEGVE